MQVFRLWKTKETKLARRQGYKISSFNFKKIDQSPKKSVNKFGLERFKLITLYKEIMPALSSQQATQCVYNGPDFFFTKGP